MIIEVETATQNNFNLKRAFVDLLGGGVTGRVTMSVVALETIRTHGRMVPASKHGLEVICGASCETGAQ